MKSLNITEIAMYGREPKFADNIVEISDSELARAYTWYNYACDNEDSQRFTIQYMKEQEYEEEEIESVLKNPITKFNTVGWLARMRTNGANLTDRSVDFLIECIEELIESGSNIDAPVLNTATEGAYSPSVAERTKDISSFFIAELEEIIDKKQWDFNPYNWMLSKDVKAIHAKRILEKYDPLLEELIEVSQCKKGSDLAEAYGFFKRDEFVKYFELIQRIVADADRLADNLKAARKPRAKKKPSVSKVISKVQYKVRDDEYKITSIDPSKIIGAKEVWLFNTKTRVFSRIIADGELSIKGTTIQNMDEKASVMRRARKPEKVITEILAAGKVQLRNLMNTISATEYPATGRLNTDTVILKVL